MTYATEHLVAADGTTTSRYFLDGAEVSGDEYTAAERAALDADYAAYFLATMAETV